MSWLTQTLSSSIGKKLIVALTGLFLCTFLIVHAVGNLQLFKSDEGLAFNMYTVFMTTNPLIKTISYGLYAFILIHAFYGFYLAYVNRKARGTTNYARINNQSSWSSRNMAVLGTVLLVFIIVHMSEFWYEYKFGHLPYKSYTIDLAQGTVVNTENMPADFVLNSKMEEKLNDDNTTKTIIVKDLYVEAQEAFSNPLLVLFYVLGMVAVSLHLIHGFRSAMQTLGANHPKYNPLFDFVGVWLFAILIPVAFAAMPIYFFVQHLMQ
ncbi:succinate dehydrogenase cytochrome b subunit [Arundinibacter roseus]|uniref:Succinate dehydrogenase cytochrome b subunit n=1 Tax=Arundinibacter roseus TaxID=2070510 RepID=A0A4R4KKS5_9BACT|nr:succinate dehydrogenase cytochrome b subunit [Arundinibacter roseus]TDB68887.1 succinate dehydrogenase cytochrome b subunit [Arundinibacter roseus]